MRYSVLEKLPRLYLPSPSFPLDSKNRYVCLLRQSAVCCMQYENTKEIEDSFCPYDVGKALRET